MRAVWLEEGAVRVRDDAPEPDPPEGEAVVRVLAAGICGTDLELLRGYYPFTGIPGHEFVGVVERGPEALSGRRVVGEINAACGACRACEAGRPTHCEHRTVLGIAGRHGAFAERLALPVANLHPVPDGVTDEAAVFAEPLAAAVRVREQVEVGPGHRVAVVGDGRLGQLVARVLALSGCDLTVTGRHPRKLALLAEAGIRASVDPPEAGVHDVAVECTGGPSGFEAARRALRPRGTLVMKSTYAGELRLDASRVVVDELTLLGSRCGPFEPALALLAAGEVDPVPLVDARFPLERAPEALERAAGPGVLKVLLDVASSRLPA